MPRIPLADLPSQNVSGARMPYADSNALTAPAQAVMGLGEKLQSMAEKWKEDKARMDEFNTRLGLEKLNTDIALNTDNNLAASAPDGSDFPAIQEKALNDGYKKLRAGITDPEMAAQADLIFERMRGDVLVKSAAAASEKRTYYVTSETDKGISSAVQLGQIKTRADAERYFETVIKPKIDLAFADPMKRDKLYGVFGKRLVDELKLTDPASLLPKRFAGDGVINAVIQAESTGNPSAISPAGAIGLMQVMPDTAAEIANEIGDQRFLSLPPDERVKYLQRRDVSIKYGTYYLNKQLQQYNGDLEAALIAYNAGPGNADKWLAAGRDYAALPKPSETLPYVTKIMGNLGATANSGRPVTSEPARFSGGMWDYVDPADLNTAQTQASSAVRDQLALGIENMQVTRSDIQNAPINDGDRAALLGQWDSKNKDMLDVMDIQQRLTSAPESIGTDDAKAADSWYKMAVGGDPSALSSNDPQVSARAASAMTEFFNKAGFLPKSAKQSLEGMVRSSDKNKVISAMMLMDGLERTNKFSFDKDVPENMRKMLDVWQAQRGYRTDEEIVKSLLEYNDPAASKAKNQLEADAKDYVTKNFDSIDKKLNVLDGGIFDWQASPPVDALSAGTFGAEFNDVFVEAYKETGNPDDALKVTQQRIGRIWGKSAFAGNNGGALMRRPPEYYYPMVDGSHDWMKSAIDAELSTLGYNVVGKNVSGPGGYVGQAQPEWSYRLLSTPETESDITTGSRSKYPRYRIFLQNKTTGQQEVLDHYYFDPAQSQDAARNQFNAAQSRSVEIGKIMNDATGPAGFDINKIGGNPLEGQ